MKGITEVQTVRILHVEANDVVSNMVKETLELEGWSVDTCADGSSALERIGSEAGYDLLLLDNNLPGISGMELLRRSRLMAHRRETPIIMFSFDLIDTEARHAGASEVLRKPEDIRVLSETIARLVGRPQNS